MTWQWSLNTVYQMIPVYQEMILRLDQSTQIQAFYIMVTVVDDCIPVLSGHANKHLLSILYAFIYLLSSLCTGQKNKHVYS